MANAITKHIPNTVTCMNLFSGCIACVMAFHSSYKLAMTFIVLSAVFDFFDGMLARLLKAPSAIGKELDSLADDVSFGVAPALIAFSLLREPCLTYPGPLCDICEYLPYVAFVIAVFSLAKFNIDERQTTSFIGMPTPANALFWGAFAAGGHDFIMDHLNAPIIILLVLLFSWLLVAEIPMFSLKFKNLSWASNKVTYIFLIVSVVLIATLGVSGFAAAIVWYILLSLLTRSK
jgi:CDP-diacylglycerol--serine O-phosphatidyltransferase